MTTEDWPAVEAIYRDGIAEAADIWTIQASVFPENAASLALHERAGFRGVGVRERIALKQHGPWAGHWRDTILIERRTRPNSRGR